MMSRKHYVEVARIIASQHEAVCGSPETVEALRQIMIGLADMFRGDNSRFDRQKFYEACAVPPVRVRP